MVMATFLADVLRAGGLQVEELPNWKQRGRGEMASIDGILVHHTGGVLKGDRPSLNLVVNGRPDLAGPLSNLFLTRAGVWVVLAAGRCNHAGAGNWQNVTAGNSRFLGVEAENAGTTADPWPAYQMESYQRGCAVILKHLGKDQTWVAGHREYALPKGRKIDPLFDMDVFRSAVRMEMAGKVIPVAHTPIAPARVMLRRGDTGASVKLLQEHVGVAEDGDFGPATERAVKRFQTSAGLVADGIVGPKTWAALGIR